MNIFLDTSFFIKQNYTKGNNIRYLFTLGNQDVIKLYVTGVNVDEVYNRIGEDVKSTVSAISKFRRELNNKHKIIKNYKSIDYLVGVDVNSNNIDEVSNEIIEIISLDFRQFLIFGNVSIIDNLK